MTNPSDLDNRLRRDLADSVSDVRADQLMVSRLISTAQQGGAARRPHRVWIAPLLAAAAVIAIVVTTVAVTSSAKSHHGAPIQPGNSSPLPAHSSSPVTPHVTPPVTTGVDVLGPTGYRGLRLGMTGAQALASGEVTKIDPYINGGACALIHLKGAPVKSDAGDGYLSKQYGIVAIFSPLGAKTPEGIGAGSTIAEVARAYPGTVYDISTRRDAGPRVPVPGHADEYYEIPDGGKGVVQSISLVLKAQDCFG